MKLLLLRPFTAWLRTVTSSVRNRGSICPHPRSGFCSGFGLSAIVESPTVWTVVFSGAPFTSSTERSASVERIFMGGGPAVGGQVRSCARRTADAEFADDAEDAERALPADTHSSCRQVRGALDVAGTHLRPPRHQRPLRPP